MSSADLAGNLEAFKKYNAARKFKKAANAVMAVNRMKMLLSQSEDSDRLSPLIPPGTAEPPGEDNAI
jgi:hypothetical protein